MALIKTEKQIIIDYYTINYDQVQVNYDVQGAVIYKNIKRLMDIIIAFVGFFISLPILIVFCFLVKIDSPGPAFYLQERVGLNGKSFKIIKLRSMFINAEIKGAQWAIKGDPRVTKVGAFIRKTRIDEIPQLINVLKGEMSIIGPRPERLIFTELFNNKIPGFVNRLLVKPGITGWAQVNGGYDITPQEKLKLDLYYIREASIWLDIKILARTIKVVITGDGAR